MAIAGTTENFFLFNKYFNIKILENKEKKRVSRKKFLFYSGLVLVGIYGLIKIPMNIFGKKEREKFFSGEHNEIKFEKNPEAVKRS